MKKQKVVIATLGSYHTYFSTGMVPFNPKRLSKKAKAFLKFMKLEWVLKSTSVSADSNPSKT